jgi:hypothetical protein
VDRFTKLDVVVGAAAVLIGLITATYPEPQASSPAFWVLILLSLSVSFHLLLLPTKSAAPPTVPQIVPNARQQGDPVAEIEKLVESLKPTVIPPSLAYLALADHAEHPESHGSNVAAINQSWERPSHKWHARSQVLLQERLLDKIGSSEYATSKLGRLYVALALTNPHYREVAQLVRYRGPSSS